jgi:hypothetical protein
MNSGKNRWLKTGSYDLNNDAPGAMNGPGFTTNPAPPGVKPGELPQAGGRKHFGC